MPWSVASCFLFLFIYRSNGSPVDGSQQIQASSENITQAGNYTQAVLPMKMIPSQWATDSQLPYHWPKGEVPYIVDSKSYDDVIKTKVQTSMATLERDSCIRFKELKEIPQDDSSWLHFSNPGGQRECSHETSYNGQGEILVVLGYDCLKQAQITHSVMHGIGFRDEISHPQRDMYVKVMWDNIQAGHREKYRIQQVEHAAGLMEYDPMSIMHFHDRAFTQNGQATVSALLPGLKISPSESLSHLDKVKLRTMFGHECNRRKVGEVLDTCTDILGTTEDPVDYNTKTTVHVYDPLVDPSPSTQCTTDQPIFLSTGGDSVPAESDSDQEYIIVGNDVNEPKSSELAENGEKEYVIAGNDIDDAAVDQNQVAENSGEDYVVAGNDVGQDGTVGTSDEKLSQKVVVGDTSGAY